MSIIQCCKNNRNRLIIAIVLRLRKLRCCQKLQLLAMSAKQRCDIHHNSMRTRSIFDVFDSLNSVFFVFQNKSSNVYFTFWMQMLLRCEIDEIAKRVRNYWNSDFDAKISQSYQIWLLILRNFDKVFFKKTFEFTCEFVKLCFFLNHSRKCFFRFLTQVDYRIRKKYFKTRKSRL